MKKFLSKYKNWNPSMYAIILFFSVVLLIFSIQSFRLDNDFWFLVNLGKTILKEGFIHIEPFTIHSGLYFIPQQWLTDIIFNFIYSNFGIRGIYYLVLLCSAIVMFLLYKTCILVCNNKKWAMIITIFTSIFLMLFSDTITTRPQLFDAIIFSLELFLLESYVQKNKQKYLYFIPLMSIFLINYHAAVWLMLFVLMIPYYIENIILRYKKQEVYKLRPLIIVTIASLVVALINPYGFEAIKYLINSYGISKINNTVGEMKPVTISSLGGLGLYIVIFLILVTFYQNKNNNKIRLFLLFIGLAYLTLSHYKGIIFFSVSIPLILGYNCRKNNDDYNMKLCLTEKIVYAICIIGIISIIMFAIPMKNEITIAEFADYLDQNASHDIKLYTNYNDGAYMEYRGYKCYIDARAEVFLKKNNHVEDIFDEYYDVEIGKQNPKAFLEKYHFDYLLVGENSYMLYYELSNNSQYEVVLSKIDNQYDEIKYLFKNNGGE